MPYALNRFIALTPRAVTLWKRLSKASALAREIHALPTVSINLMLEATNGAPPFFRDVTIGFYRTVCGPHAKFPLIARMRYGVAVCDLRQIQHDHYGHLDSAGKRNVKKARRLGYRFAPFDFNAHLDAATRIHRSSVVRQGRQVHDWMLDEAKAHANPPSQSHLHAYPYFGIFQGDTLVAYAACLIAGELCMIQTIYGHAQFHSDGIIPLLLTSISDHLKSHHPQVAYYAYGTYYGATPSMQRFKRKFLFEPCCVNWHLS
ncbi:MAG: hypothetical protein HYX44_07090 [Aquabacterium sp.]|nr:hypothetical protein [Aquabacterium sp.]